MKVLHVTECMNGGVAHAIFHLRDRYPENEHFLLWDSHSDAPVPIQEVNERFAQTNFTWKGNYLQRLIKLKALINQLEIDLLHLHSSRAGFLGRIVLGTVNKATVYSPHCFAFERRDIFSAIRVIFYLIEYFLSKRTTYYLANWPNEVNSILKFGKSVTVYLEPLIDITSLAFKRKRKTNLEVNFLAVGRLSQQKDPDFYAKVRNHYLQENHANFLWVGAVDDQEVQAESNFTLLKWLNQQDLKLMFREATATIITSKWESGPLTLYQSLDEGTPVVVRSAHYSDMLGISAGDSPEKLSQMCSRLSNDPTFRNTLLHLQVLRVKETFEPLISEIGFKGYHSIES